MDSPSYFTNSASTTASPCTSPAALFLSAFSSPPQSQFLPVSDLDSNSASGFEAGDVLNGYVLGKQIGQGAFSVIRLATYPTRNGIVAIKLATTTTTKQKDKDKSERERRIWESLSHEHILPLFSAFTIADRTCFVTMYCPAGSLYDLLKSHQGTGLPAPVLQPIFTQLVRALVYLHTEARVVHRDLKLENLLVDEGGGVRLTDFGLARGIDEDSDDAEEDSDPEPEEETPATVHRTLSLSTSTPSSGIITRKQSLNINLSSHPSLIRPGTYTPRHRHSTTSHTPSRKPKKSYGQPGSLPYAAPELFSSPSTDQQQHPTIKVKVNPAQDIWALGILLHTLLTGKLPWNDAFEPRLVWRIVCGPYSLPTNISPLASRILLGCLERDPGKRWNAGMIDEVAWGVTQELSSSSSVEDELVVTERLGLFSPIRPSSEVAVSLSPRRDPSHSLSPTRRRRRSRDPSSTPYSRSKSRSTPRSRDSYSESRSPPPALSFSVQSVLSTASHDFEEEEVTRFPRRIRPDDKPEEGEMMRGRLPTRRHSPLPLMVETDGLPLPTSSIGFPSLLDTEGNKAVEGLPSLELSPVHLLSPVPLSPISASSGVEDHPQLELPLVAPNPPLLLRPHQHQP